MALINADELMEWCNNHYDFEVYTVGYISNLIKDMPTVDAEPVRHGKWINREYGLKRDGRHYPFWERYECSVCGAKADESDYCPNCGAKMDAERKEG